VRKERKMLRELIQLETEEQTYQTLLLKEDTSREVEVHEAKQVDFSRIYEHLRQGGSVFITSKHSQKLPLPNIIRKSKPRKRKAARTVTAFYYDHV
jgi:hypothetical protein